jgi:hypothetical protein
MLVVAAMWLTGVTPALAATAMPTSLMKSGGWSRFSMFGQRATTVPSVDLALAAQALRPRVEPTAQSPSVVCGMKVVPVNPRFDASIRRQAPTRPTPSIKTMTPSCKAR